jgi:putative solute:sodium symporter small subunit
MSDPSHIPRNRYWRKTLHVTAALLALWMAASFGVAMFARELTFELFGAPFGVWIAGQGALVVFLLIVWAAAVFVDRDEHGSEAVQDEQQ